jgi:type IV pilus assembly protein PilM
MSLFSGKSSEHFDGLLGVDIGPSSIKIVELVEEKGRLRLSTYGYSEAASVDENQTSLLDSPDKAAEIIKQIIKDAGMKATRVVTALPSAQVFQTIVTIPPGKSKEEIKSLIETQTTKLLPMPLADMIVDSNILDKDLLPKDEKKPVAGVDEEANRESGKNIRVLVTAAPKALVQKYINLFQQTKLELVSLETEVFALIRSLIGKDKSRVMLVDMGHNQTNIAIVDKGVPYLHRSMKGGGLAVTTAIASSMGISFAEAERVKCDLSLSSHDAEPPKAVQDALTALVHELKYSLELYAAQAFHDNQTVEKIIITGGGAHLPALDPYLTKVLNVNVYIGDPWARIASPVGLRPVLDEVGPRFSIAVGLAMRISEKDR